jgi:hypothetical protein
MSRSINVAGDDHVDLQDIAASPSTGMQLDGIDLFPLCLGRRTIERRRLVEVGNRPAPNRRQLQAAHLRSSVGCVPESPFRIRQERKSSTGKGAGIIEIITFSCADFKG